MKVEQAEIEIVLEFNQQIFHSKGHPWYWAIMILFKQSSLLKGTLGTEQLWFYSNNRLC
jgi:hypothetical protein